ncbi:m04 [Muromegalovirus WP15B]|uniref:M04 n=1 Tax=Muromegalovirus WP15B TaxID=524651 RepID=B3UXD1_MUHV1|nr:m04 [Muromegalovirus WP15B]
MFPVRRLMLTAVLLSGILSSVVSSYNAQQECEKIDKKYKEKMKDRYHLGCYFKAIVPSKTSKGDKTMLTCKLPDVHVNASWTLEWVVVKLQNSLDIASYYTSSPSSGPKFIETILNYTPIGRSSSNLLTVKNGFDIERSSTNGDGGNLYVYSNATEGSADSVKCRLKMCPWTSNVNMKTPDNDMLQKMKDVLTLPDYNSPPTDPGPKYDYYAKKTPPADMTVTTLTVIVTLLYVVAFCLLAYVFGPSLYRRFFSSDCCSNFKPLKNN